MKFGSFLFGGLVGAAAVVYFNKKSKSMLFSALTSNQSLGNVMDKTKKSANAAFKKDDPFSTEGMDKIKDIVKEDPGLQATVNEILADNNPSADHQNEHHVQ